MARIAIKKRERRKIKTGKNVREQKKKRKGKGRKQLKKLFGPRQTRSYKNQAECLFHRTTEHTDTASLQVDTRRESKFFSESSSSILWP